MYLEHKVVVVLPAYNAERTLRKTYEEIPFDIVDEVLLCDDYSSDRTTDVAAELGIKHIIRHKRNRGYGANQKSLYQAALDQAADIIVMLHPDYQYTPRLIAPMVHILAQGSADVVLGSRILGAGALRGGMPLYKYVANRALTLVQNLLVGYKLSEYHTGYRAYHSRALKQIAFMDNSDDFIFDNEVLSQLIYAGFHIAEVSCPARYAKDSSSINFRRSTIYGLGVLRVSIMHWLQRWRLAKFALYQTPPAPPPVDK